MNQLIKTDMLNQSHISSVIFSSASADHR